MDLLLNDDGEEAANSATGETPPVLASRVSHYHDTRFTPSGDIDGGTTASMVATVTSLSPVVVGLLIVSVFIFYRARRRRDWIQPETTGIAAKAKRRKKKQQVSTKSRKLNQSGEPASVCVSSTISDNLMKLEAPKRIKQNKVEQESKQQQKQQPQQQQKQQPQQQPQKQQQQQQSRSIEISNGASFGGCSFRHQGGKCDSSIVTDDGFVVVSAANRKASKGKCSNTNSRLYFTDSSTHQINRGQATPLTQPSMASSHYCGLRDLGTPEALGQQEWKPRSSLLNEEAQTVQAGTLEAVSKSLVKKTANRSVQNGVKQQNQRRALERAAKTEAKSEEIDSPVTDAEQRRGQLCMEEARNDEHYVLQKSEKTAEFGTLMSESRESVVPDHSRMIDLVLPSTVHGLEEEESPTLLRGLTHQKESHNVKTSIPAFDSFVTSKGQSEYPKTSPRCPSSCSSEQGLSTASALPLSCGGCGETSVASSATGLTGRWCDITDDEDDDSSVTSIHIDRESVEERVTRGSWSHYMHDASGQKEDSSRSPVGSNYYHGSNGSMPFYPPDTPVHQIPAFSPHNTHFKLHQQHHQQQYQNHPRNSRLRQNRIPSDFNLPSHCDADGDWRRRQSHQPDYREAEGPDGCNPHHDNRKNYYYNKSNNSDQIFRNDKSRENIHEDAWNSKGNHSNKMMSNHHASFHSQGRETKCRNFSGIKPQNLLLCSSSTTSPSLSAATN